MLYFFSLHSLMFGESSDAMSHQSSPPAISNKNVTPTARTCSDLDGVYVTGEFIYWKARQEELIYVAFADLQVDFLVTGNQKFDFKQQEAKFQFDPGFKLGVGWDLPFDGWDLYLNWTRFHNHPHSSLSSDTNNIIALFGGLFGSAGIPFLGRRAKANWDLRFNSLDFDWGRRFYLSETFSVRPSFGGKAVWIHQKFDFAVLDTEVLEGLPFTTPPGFPVTLKMKNDFWGIGPYFTFDGKWTFAWGVGLYGEISTALLWGKFEQEQKFTKNRLSQNQGQFIVIELMNQINFEAYRVRPTIQSFIGLDWEWCFIPKWLSVNFRAGYETQYFWSQLVNPTEGVEEGDLTFEGFTFMGRIDF